MSIESSPASRRPIGAYWEPKINDRIRVVLQYNKLVRPIFWFQVRRDGSIYFGVRRKNAPVMKKGSKMTEAVASDDGGVGQRVRIDYSEGEIVYSPESRKNPRVSHHASGVVHLGESIFPSKSINSIDKGEEIANILFEPLTVFPLDKKEKKDVPIPFKFEEDKPLVGQLFVLPSNIRSEWTNPIINKGAVSHFSYIFGYTGLDGCQDFALHLALYTVAGGPWPPYNYIVMREYRPQS